MIPEPNPRQRAWVEVAPGAIRANARALCQHLSPRTQLMAVVKADGYGHGAETVARAALEGGATSLGVATLKEGLELRQAGLEAPVLLLSNLSEPDELRTCLRWRLVPTLSSLRDAQLCNALASDSGRCFDVQLKIDTGMARLGCSLSDGRQTVAEMQKLEHLNLEGIYSHLACADETDDALTSIQQQRFVNMLSALPQGGAGINRHLANSAGTLLSRELHYDLVRVGLALYGHAPASHLCNVIDLQPALAVRARVSLIREVPTGTGVSYGHRFITERPTRLALVGIGYADGVLRSLSGQIQALHRNRMLPQVGAITMDQLLLDATDAGELKEGDIVTLLGKDGDLEVRPQSWSDKCGSIPWEILCGFKKRLPRVEV